MSKHPATLDNPAIGRRMRTLRESHGLVQAQMADIAGVALRAYQTYERGESAVPASLLVALRGRFACDPIWLLTGAAAGAVQAVPVQSLRNAILTLEGTLAELRAALPDHPVIGSKKR